MIFMDIRMSTMASIEMKVTNNSRTSGHRELVPFSSGHTQIYILSNDDKYNRLVKTKIESGNSKMAANEVVLNSKPDHNRKPNGTMAATEDVESMTPRSRRSVNSNKSDYVE